MNAFEQFNALLTGLEDSENKTNLVKAFGEVTNVFNDAISTRDTAKQKLGSNDELLKNIGQTLGFESDFNLDNVKEKISKLSNSEKLESLKTDLTNKHENEMSELRTLLETEKNSKVDLTTRLNDLSFSKTLKEDGLLNGFSTAPKMLAVVENELKSKLLFEDGQIFVNDGQGNKAKDVTTGNFFTPKSVVENMLNSEDWKPFVSPQTQGKNGGGMKGNQASGQNVGGDMGGSKQDRVNAIKAKHPELNN